MIRIYYWLFFLFFIVLIINHCKPWMPSVVDFSFWYFVHCFFSFLRLTFPFLRLSIALLPPSLLDDRFRINNRHQLNVECKLPFMNIVGCCPLLQSIGQTQAEQNKKSISFSLVFVRMIFTGRVELFYGQLAMRVYWRISYL